MIKRLLLLTVFIAACVTGYGQKKSKQFKSTERDSAAYWLTTDEVLRYDQNGADLLRLIIKTDSGFYRVEDYYLNGNPMRVAHSIVKDYHFWQGIIGVYRDYYPNGNLKTTKTYNDTKVIGEAATYYPNGKLYNIKIYKPDSTIYAMEYRDSVGNVLTSNGNGTWREYMNDFNDYFEGKVVTGSKEGNWAVWNGSKMVDTLNYKSGISPKERVFDNRVYTDITQLDIAPAFVGGQSAFAQYLTGNMSYPENARKYNIQGKVLTNFVIERDGSISNVKVIRGLGSGTDEEAIRIIKNMPNWKPGSIKGYPVRTAYALPISFKL